MDNLEILKEIEKEIEICKEKINEKSEEEIKAVISDIEDLIDQYQPEDKIEIRIINNRKMAVKNLIDAGQGIKEKNGKGRKIKS